MGIIHSLAKGFPKFILGAKDLDAHYADLNIRSSEYFYNNVQSGRFTLRQNLVKLNEPVNKTMSVCFQSPFYFLLNH